MVEIASLVAVWRKFSLRDLGSFGGGQEIQADAANSEIQQIVQQNDQSKDAFIGRECAVQALGLPHIAPDLPGRRGVPRRGKLPGRTFFSCQLMHAKTLQSFKIILPIPSPAVTLHGKSGEKLAGRAYLSYFPPPPGQLMQADFC